METIVHRRERPTGVAGFAAGFWTPWVGLQYMNRHPGLWRHAILPIFCNFLLTLLFMAALVYGGQELFAWVQAKFPAGAGWFVLKVLTAVALVAVALGLTISAWVLFQGILCGYFYSALAREVEIQLGLRPADMREVPLWYQLVDAVFDLVALAGVAVGCLALSFIPVIGAIAAAAIGGYFNCLVFGMDFFDYPQALRAIGRKQQRAFARRHRAATLGLGASVTLLSLVPILSSVLLTTSATGAVLLYRRLEPEAAGKSGP